MLDRAVISHPGLLHGNIDVGRILDAMLYYGHVSLIVDAGTFVGLWQRLGRDGVTSLLTHPTVQVELTPEMPAIYNERRGGVLTHRPVYMTLAGRDGAVRSKVDPVRSLHQLLNNSIPTPLADVRRLVSKLPKTRFDRLLPGESTNQRMFESLIRDADTMKLFLREWVQKRGGRINLGAFDALDVRVERFGSEFMVIANLPLASVAADVKFENEWASILGAIQRYSHDLYLAEARSADVITPDDTAEIAAQRIDLSLLRASRSNEQLSAFETVAFGEGRPFGAAFNAGEIDLKTALSIVDDSRRFRGWLAELPPHADILHEYHKAVSREPAISGLKGSTLRFALFTGGGLLGEALIGGGVGIATGVGLSFFDTFLVEKLLKGWRPNVFVENATKRLRKQ